MLEALRVLATSAEALRHAVVFLFNGAEENVLQVRTVLFEMPGLIFLRSTIIADGMR